MFSLVISNTHDLSLPKTPRFVSSHRYKSTRNRNTKILSNQPRFSSPPSQRVNRMLFTAVLTFALSLGSSLVTASPISSVSNSTGLVRACGSTPSSEWVAQAEAHFAKNKVVTTSGPGIEVASIPVYCAPESVYPFYFLPKADICPSYRACDL